MPIGITSDTTTDDSTYRFAKGAAATVEREGGTDSVDRMVERYEIALDIRRAWESRPDSPYAQVGWDPVSQRLLVHRVPGNKEFDADVTSRATATVAVGLVDAARSFREVEAIKREILAARDLPVRVSMVGTNLDGSIVVEAEGDLPAARQALDARYGPGTAIVEERGSHDSL